MIKGLYFKLNMDNLKDREIYDFFTKYSSKHLPKIELLFLIIKNFKYLMEEKND